MPTSVRVADIYYICMMAVAWLLSGELMCIRCLRRLIVANFSPAAFRLHNISNWTVCSLDQDMQINGSIYLPDTASWFVYATASKEFYVKVIKSARFQSISALPLLFIEFLILLILTRITVRN